MAELDIAVIPLLKDNYGYLIHDTPSGATAASSSRLMMTDPASPSRSGSRCFAPSTGSTMPAIRTRARRGSVLRLRVTSPAFLVAI